MKIILFPIAVLMGTFTFAQTKTVNDTVKAEAKENAGVTLLERKPTVGYSVDRTVCNV